MMMTVLGLITSSSTAVSVARIKKVALHVVPVAFTVQSVDRANDAAEMSV